ncbi:helix-turn-helix domain-containing protein [Streptomyces sp. NBC_00237]|uniref:helix-turn-helix domain-containing protein n=1 Tax=Streptomyces sp. NBC_00237 TaxID=2975687 RepID=UPI00224F88D5|nr:helix-turn-helix domain-containing protein [Streptomyces sp. NBC_00237]MCX5202675.1 helix-turn-helix domain-containing protein [Streptomyces sp. NBC_00237]
MPDPNDNTTDNALPSTFGKRVKRARERQGKTRALVAGFMGRSTEWVKAIETDRLHMPRLPLLLRLAEAIGVDDLAELTGEERLAASTFTKGVHPGLPRIRNALTTYNFRDSGQEPQSAAELAARVRQAWDLWHGNGDHRSRIADLVPGLLEDLQHAARAYDGTERRRVLVALAETYHLTQLYLSFQPAPDLVMLTGDRAMSAAQDADSPRAIAVAAWYMNHVFRDAGEASEARVDLAMKADALIRTTTGNAEDIARHGLLHLAAALSYAKVGRDGDAWRHWDKADRAAKKLGPEYTHPYLIFGNGMVDAYRLTIHTDLSKPGQAVDVATTIDLAPMPSATRRSFHMTESARAYRMEGEDMAVVHLLKKAYQTSPETSRFNIFTRSTVTELVVSGPAMLRDDIHYLARELKIPA